METYFHSPRWLYLRNVITCRTRALQLRNWGCTYLKKQISWTIKLKLRWNHISARTWRCKNYHHVNRLVLRIVFAVFFFFKSYALTFCTRSQITWRYFFPVFHYFNSAVLRRLHRIPSKLHMSKLMNHKPSEGICDLLALRPSSHITQKTLYFLYSTEIKQITKTTVIFKTDLIFVCCVRCNPIPPRTPSSGSRILATLPLAVHACEAVLVILVKQAR